MVDLYLASRSPRRFELLQQLGLKPEVISVECEEIVQPDERAEDFVLRVSREKAAAGVQEVLHHGRPIPVLAADTSVIADGQILGKPDSFEHACEMWAQLSGSSHRVLTSVVVRLGEKELFAVQESAVTMREIQSPEMQWYWDSGEPQDKAGGYAVQGLAAIFIKQIQGSYSGIMGLPLYETAQILKGFGVDVLPQHAE